MNPEQTTALNQSVTKPLAISKPLTQPSVEQLQRDAGYWQAQKLLQNMLDAGLISLLEYNKITMLNRKSFSPY